MEFRCRTTDEPQPPPQFREHQPPRPPVLSAYGYVAEQFIPAGYRKPGFGPGNDHFGEGIGHNNECFRQATRWANNYFRISSDVHEEIQRSIEKERIRDEIIATEIAKRQVLEADVRAEIRMERELALRATGGLFNRFLFPLGAGMVSEPKGGTFQQEAKGLEERIAMCAGERLRMGARSETRVFDTLPFWQSAEPEAKGLTPSHMENSKQKEKIVFLVKSIDSLSGAKRKVISPAEEIGNTEGKEKWSCAICQVNTNSEHVLKDHFQGKKHKSKEAALRAESNGYNIGLGVSPYNAVKPIIKETHVLSSLLVDGKALQNNQSALNLLPGLKLEGEALQINQSEPSSLHTVSTEYLDENSMSILRGNEKKDKLKNEKLVGVQKAPKSKLKKKENFTFWCDMCQVGTYCEIVMEDHRKGKKHLKLFKKARENGLANLTSQIVDIRGANVSDETPKEGDKKAFENVDGTSPKVDVQYFDVNGNWEKEDYEAAKGAVGTLDS